MFKLVAVAVVGEPQVGLDAPGLIPVSHILLHQEMGVVQVIREQIQPLLAEPRVHPTQLRVY
jgi:hypothetical protein